MRAARSLPIVAAALVGCGGGLGDPRAAEITSVLAEADQAFIRARPALSAGKYQLMASDPYAYFRGTLAVYRHDWESAAYGLSPTAHEAGTLPVVVGDAHPENFGILRARDVSFALEPNDFDSADRAPYLWDLRRLAAGMSISARLSNPDDANAAAAATAAARSIARAAAEGYAEAMAGFAAGAPPARVTDDGAAVLDDLFSRSKKDTAARTELAGNTVLTGTTRTLARGVLDPTVPYQAYGDLPPGAYAALPATLDAYRGTLIDPPPPEYFTLLDAARIYGSGVASWPKVRVALLVRGPTDDPGDDVLLELKELTDSTILVSAPARYRYDDDGARILATSRAVWAIPDADPLWGTSSWLGFPCQIKTETDGEKTFRVKRLTGARGTPEAITAFARTLGALLARMHAAPPGDGSDPRAAIAAAIGGDVGAFADEQAEAGDAYAQRVLADQPLFAAALAQLGPTLGITLDPADAPPPDLAAVYGTPPPAIP